MTKKDYELIAQALAAVGVPSPTDAYNQGQAAMHFATVKKMAEALASEAMCGIKIGFNTREEARDFIRENYKGRKNKIKNNPYLGFKWVVIL